MQNNELFLKTLFCCCTCDGEIAPEEVALVKELSTNEAIFQGIEVETILNQYVSQINKKHKNFLKEYLNELSEANLSEEEQLTLLGLAIKMIEADNQILYSEIKFFKMIRKRLYVTDETILKAYPESEDYLLSDVLSEDKDFADVGNFALISFEGD